MTSRSNIGGLTMVCCGLVLLATETGRSAAINAIVFLKKV
jgi:hypothetical protein